MPLKVIHCRLCGKAIKGMDFAERMKKLRHHRKLKHPTAHKRSVAKAMVTKGYDKAWRRKAKLDPESMYAFEKKKLDPLKARKGLIKKPRIRGHKDFHGSGLIRVLFREKDLFPEFAIYPKAKIPTQSLIDAGLKEESKGKWVLRTNKFNIFVYI